MINQTWIAKLFLRSLYWHCLMCFQKCCPLFSLALRKYDFFFSFPFYPLSSIQTFPLKILHLFLFLHFLQRSPNVMYCLLQLGQRIFHVCIYKRVFTREQSVKFELRIIFVLVYFAQFKCWSGGVFQWRISQITQWYRRMNALTSKLWFGGRSYMYMTF